MDESPSTSFSKGIDSRTGLESIPLGNGNETLAYEFIGTFNDSTYYIYLDANTLKEVEIYKVVITEEGTLLI